LSAISTYGVGRTTVPPVYGGFSNGGVSALGGNLGGGKGCTGCEPNVPYVTTLLEFVSILEYFKSAIDNFYPNDTVGMAISGRVSARGKMDIRYMARVEWIRRFKDTKGKFDVTSPAHVDLLKEVFLSLGADWRIDKWLREWQTPEHHCYSATRSGDT
jgi:hypothetical protein